MNVGYAVRERWRDIRGETHDWWFLEDEEGSPYDLDAAQRLARLQAVDSDGEIGVFRLTAEPVE